jgi:hypothetical protein
VEGGYVSSRFDAVESGTQEGIVLFN